MKKILPAAVILFLSACKNGEKETNGIEMPPPPQTLNFSIIQPAYPHDTSSFTQGLSLYKGELFEGTGNYGRSKLMKVDLKTGKALKSVSLDEKYFGEGITVLNDTIYQLTWKENVVFAYTVKDFKKVKEFPLKTEGWGITTDGKNLIISSGGGNLDYYDPSSFTVQKTLAVSESGTQSYNLNELEYIDDYIYSNQWGSPYIFKINPADGRIVAKADLTQLWDRVKTIYPGADVPNGIAYDSATKKIYVTGKLWPELYEIQFGQ
jgi:glutamine cyclotransferase